MFGKFRFRGEGGRSGKNDHEFHFLGNIELYERPLTYFGWTFVVEFLSGVYHPQDTQDENLGYDKLSGKDGPRTVILRSKYMGRFK